MKIALIMVLLAGVVGHAAAADRAMTPQQQRMTSCNQQATSQTLKGDERKAYMSNCLKNSQSAPGEKSLTPQQQKMKACNAEAGKQTLTGEARKTFMSNCLKRQVR
ncbi:PsiF family protein [Enterobacteriaceae bacterium H20N1]|uniref:PsiF family protein n=1 Tax=Dryocola boscaweniae TaxID=2925397 RepID=A0A9X2W6P8_9ENTR|nr:PsiF family protein [Dryocola boscaweniae]MCT4701083.1 PsiF family protein [Dryocola boscaweniae]MCT4714529.1 PsiF family protein [Dryocola boscaweniae]MCT4718127.1 PsiF family protein [Dryocola boscaweniae]